jgi:hypothetical protein
MHLQTLETALEQLGGAPKLSGRVLIGEFRRFKEAMEA